MFESVVFLPRNVALELTPDPHAVFISLTSPKDPASISTGWRGVLQLEFDDLCEVALGVPVGSVPDVDKDGHLVREFFGAMYRLPDAHHAKAIVEFLAQHQSGCSDFVRVVVHCDHGISRSAAVAQYAADKYNVLILNADPEWQNRVAMLDTSRANPRLLRLLNAWSDPYYDPILRAFKDEGQKKFRAEVRAGLRTSESAALINREAIKLIKVKYRDVDYDD